MPSFQKRSYTKELLDRTDLPFADIRLNMQELDTINRLLGGHAITRRGLKQVLRQAHASSTVSVVEIGCGGGDNLRALRGDADLKRRIGSLFGVDINPECIAFAESLPANKGIRFLKADYRDVVFEEKPDVIFSSLFCHHFTDEELRDMLKWMKANSRLGFFINDLHRHPLAYHSIRWLTRAFSKSYLVKNDAPLSVQRGFVRSDWLSLLSDSGIDAYQCRWKWAFRWLIVFTHAS